jgi:hypothetical protein
MAAEDRKADGSAETVSSVTREFNRSARKWVDSLSSADYPGANCDSCGITGVRLVSTGSGAPVCEVCAASSRGFDQGEANMIAELMVMAMEAVHRKSDTLSSDCFAVGAQLAGERFEMNWKRA